MPKPAIVIITGLSGSGKTVALRALEDGGFFCIDNLPVILIDLAITRLVKKGDISKIAISVDIRELEFFSKVDSAILNLKGKYKMEIIFLEAEKDVLVRRFKETRRPHPLTASGKSRDNVEASIDKEKEMLMPLRKEADRIIDTSSYTPHQLRHLITSLYSGSVKTRSMFVTLMSFGYKFGVPQNVDLLFDIRFIPNPHFVPQLKDLSGIDKPVKKFIFGKPETKEFIKRVKGLLGFLFPLYIREGKAYLTIGVGCTGGKHRSPAIVEEIASIIKGHPIDINIVHRDL